MKLCAGSGGHLSAVEGIKYPGGFIVGISRGGGVCVGGRDTAESRLCAGTVRKGGRLECMASSEYFMEYLIEINVISDGYTSK